MLKTGQKVKFTYLKQFKDELKAVQERLLDMCDSAEGIKEQVMQINLQLFPLSEPPDGEAQ